jgi:hypothetical protein
MSLLAHGAAMRAFSKNSRAFGVHAAEAGTKPYVFSLSMALSFV